jgi:Tol biopolymer transport system component
MDSDALLGQEIAHYRIIDKLGEGGMGVVYRALDTRLDRMVALKLLPGPVADTERKKRFFQEAKAASSLNHPNIITIYDIGTSGDLVYLAMEYVAGKTLYDCIGGAGMRPREALGYAVQIVDALAAAHNAGIIHRDLKPTNIMITDKGLVKVLDFGLAKLTEPAENSPLTATRDAAPLTAAGLVVGTAAYMSPEQAEARKVDGRSDIFSFGIVLYEMLTGRRPFQGTTFISTLAAILNKEPTAVRELSKDVPPELERIIIRCLRKEPERRFQHMDDLKVALEELREELISGHYIYSPVSSDKAPGSAAGDAAIRGRRLPAYLLPAAALAAAALAGAAIWWLERRSPPPPQPVLTRLTADSGLSTDPALSQDGKLLAYASDRSGEGNLDIWVQQIGGGQPIRLTKDEADEYEPAFSPDGTRIAFRSEREGGGIYVIPALGGEPRFIAGQGHRPRFSPDGNWICYWTGALGWVPGSAKIYVVPVSGGTPVQVHPEFTTARHPLWMPDGKRLLFLGRLDAAQPREQTMDWWVAPVDGGTAVRTGAFAVFNAQNLSYPHIGAESAINPGALLPKSDRAVFSATLGDAANIWEIPLSAKTGKVTGEAQRLTFGTGLELQPSVAVTPAGELQIAFSSLALNVGVWSMPLDADSGTIAGEPQRLSTDMSPESYPSVSADGKKLAFLSARLGNPAVWVRDLESGSERLLTSAHRGQFQPKISGDGAKVAYSENEGREAVSYIMSASGGPVRKLCDHCGPPTHFSRDGQKVLLESESAQAVLLIDLATGKQIQLIQAPEPRKVIPFAARFSPDERWVAFHVRPSPTARQIFVAPLPSSGALEKKDWIPITDGAALENEAYWSPDGNVLYFLSDREGFRCIWAQRLHPAAKTPVGPAFPVYHFHHARRSLSGVSGGAGAIGLSVAPGKMVFALAELTGNVWMSRQEALP